MTSPGMFIDGYIPAEYSSALTTVNANDVPYWRSLSRPMSSTKWEILKINFRQAVLITDISFDTLKISHEYNVYYTNRNGLLIPVVLSDNSFFEGSIATGDEFVRSGSLADLTSSSSWEKVKKKLYPIVAKSLEIRMRRKPDARLTTDSTYRLGIRKMTLRRTIATEQNKYLGITDSIDSVGNFVTKTFVNWEPEKAADGLESTYWKCSPQPSPNAVVSYYLDVRNQNGDSSAVDKVWIDPVYSGQQVNLYYSNDDTESTSTLSTVALAPTTEVNTNWALDTGLILSNPTADLRYNGSRLGMTSGENLWIALAINPAFDSTSLVGANLTLLSWDNISIVYNDSTKKITFKAGSLSATTGVISFSAGDRMIAILQVRSLSDANPGIEVRVYHDGALASRLTVGGNTGAINFNQSLRFFYINGNLTQAIVKRGSPTATDLSQFVSSPDTYVSPDPVVNNGDRITSTTLDNAVLGANFLSSRLVFGGSSFHRFAGKTWSPVWANYISQKGYLILPQQMNVKYIKLEFTKLTPEPYPIVDQDIEVSYREFPITFSRDTIFTNTRYTATSLDSRMGVETQIDPNAVANKYGLSYGPLDTTRVQDVQIQVGDAIYTSIPRTFDQPVTNVTNVEPASSVSLLNSTEPQSMTVVQAQSYTVVKGDTLIGIASRYGIPDWHQILNLNSDLLNANLTRAVRAGLPRHTAGWWIFPGQKLRIATAQTKEWTVTTTVTEATTRSTVNNKFTITSVHEYDIKTVKRDAAIAYFAGLKEVSVYREDFTVAADSDSFEITQFQISDAPTYSSNNVTITNSNSTTNLIKNPNFTIGTHGYMDAVNLGASYDAIASIALSNDFAYSGTLSGKITYGPGVARPQGVFARLNNLPANAYVGHTYQTCTVTNTTDDFENGLLTGWTPTGCTLVNSTAQAFAGTHSGLMTSVGTVLQASARRTIPVVPLQSYTAQTRVYSTLGYSSANVSIDWFDASGTYITTNSSTGSLAAATWTLRTVTATAPGNAVSARWGPTLGGNPPNNTALYFDNVSFTGPVPSASGGLWTKREQVVQADGSGQVDLLMVSPGVITPGDAIYLDAVGAYLVKSANSKVPSFFDGDFTNSAWNGYPGESTSTTSLPCGPEGYYTSVVATNVAKRTNLVTNPSFETNTSGWTSGGAGYDTVFSISRNTIEHYTDTASLNIVWKTLSTKQGVSYSLTGLTNGATYVAIAKVKNKTANTTECFMECGGATGRASSSLLRGQWQRIQVCWTQSGTTAVLAVASSATTNLDETYLDTIAVFQIPTLHTQAPDYFDGAIFGNSWSGTAHASTSLSPAMGVFQSPTYNTWSQFKKITATLRAKPLDVLLSGLVGATALGVGSFGLSTWDDPKSTWGDVSATWGAAASLATVNFVSSYVYNGVSSIWLHRGSSGVGGVYSAPITPFAGAHIRAEITVFLPSTLNVTSVVKIVDAATKSIIYSQETITSPRGGWQTYVTNFIISDGTQICISIESNGTVASDLYVADISLKQTTITMYASNDSWATRLDLNDLVWKTTNVNGVFQSAGNKAQVKFEMLRVGDWVSGYSVTPYYLA